MKFNLEKMPPNLKVALKVGNVFSARGGAKDSSPRFWVLVAKTNDACVLIGLNKNGEVISGTKYYNYTVEKWPVVGFVKDIESMTFEMEMY